MRGFIPAGGCGRFLGHAALCGEPQPHSAAVDRIVAQRPVIAESLEAARRPPRHHRIDEADERLRGPSRPVPPVEDLVLEGAEEALAGRVVGALGLARHGPRQPEVRADRLPSVPAVMASAVGVDDRPLAGPQRERRLHERRVREVRIGACARRPADGLAVEQVDHGALNLNLPRFR